MAVKYDKNTDYQAKINQAKASGDTAAAKQYEAQRNAKIADMNKAGTNKNNYQQTNNYSGSSGSSSGTSWKDPSFSSNYTQTITAAPDMSPYGYNPNFVLVNADGTHNGKPGDFVVTGGGVFQVGGDGKPVGANFSSTNYGDVITKYNTLTSTPPLKETPSYPGYPSYDDIYGEYMTLINAQAAAQEEAQRRQTQATIDSINSNIPKVNQDYEAQQRANYIQNAKAQTGMGDYLSAMGYSGGMAESTALGLQSNYENLRNSADQEKNNALMELQNMVAQAQATGDTNLANLAAQKYQSMVSAMQSARQSADSMAQWQSDAAFRDQQYSDSQAQQQWSNQFAEKGFAWEQEQAAIANALAKAKEARISSGSTSTKRTATPAAYSEDDIFNTGAAQSAPLANTAYQNSLLTRGLMAGGSTASVAANNIIAAIQSGEITEAEGRKRLLALGIQI